jgi:hypothetical protein
MSGKYSKLNIFKTSDTYELVECMSDIENEIDAIAGLACSVSFHIWDLEDDFKLSHRDLECFCWLFDNLIRIGDQGDIDTVHISFHKLYVA